MPRQYKTVCQFPNGSASPNILPLSTAPHAQKCADLLTAHPVRKIVPNSHGPGSANVLPICSRPTVQTLRTGWAINKSAHFCACGAVNSGSTRAWMFMEARLHLDEPMRGCSDTWMHGICSGTWMHGCMDVGMIVAWLRSARMHEWKGAWLHDAFFALGGFIVPRQYKMVCRLPNGSASPNIVPVC